MLHDVLSRLAHHHSVKVVDSEEGRADLIVRDRVVSLALNPALLDAFAESLAESDFSDFHLMTPDELNARRARRIVNLIEECIESDLDGALTGVHLVESRRGVPHLAETYGPRVARTWLPGGTEGFWSSEP